MKLCHINSSGPFFETRIHGSKVEADIFEFRRFHAANHQGLSIRSHASGIDDDSSFSPRIVFSEFVSLVLDVYRNCYRHAFVGHIIGNSYLSGSGTLSDL